MKKANNAFDTALMFVFAQFLMLIPSLIYDFDVIKKLSFRVHYPYYIVQQVFLRLMKKWLFSLRRAAFLTHSMAFDMWGKYNAWRFSRVGARE